MLLAAPEAVSSDLYTFHMPEKNTTLKTCAPYPVSERVLQEVHSLVCFLIFYILPLAIISIYYFLIARTLYKSTSSMPAEEQGHARKQVGKNVQSAFLTYMGLSKQKQVFFLEIGLLENMQVNPVGSLNRRMFTDM